MSIARWYCWTANALHGVSLLIRIIGPIILNLSLSQLTYCTCVPNKHVIVQAMIFDYKYTTLNQLLQTDPVMFTAVHR